ncbi:hypothetical protein BKA93DRAFT_927993 [Sparassis latifolia]
MPSNFGSELFGFPGPRLELEAPVTACDLSVVISPLDVYHTGCIILKPHDLPLCTATELDEEPVNGGTDHILPQNQVISTSPYPDNAPIPDHQDGFMTPNLEGIHSVSEHVDESTQTACNDEESECFFYPGGMEDIYNKLLQAIGRSLPPGCNNEDLTQNILTLLSDSLSTVITGDTAAPIPIQAINTPGEVLRGILTLVRHILMPSTTAEETEETTAPIATEVVNTNPGHIHGTTPLTSDTSSSAMIDETPAPILTEAVDTDPSAIGGDTTAPNFGLDDIPESTTHVIPKSTHVIPEATQIIPESTQIIPESTQIIPKSTQIIPESTQIIPESTQIIPQELPSEGLEASDWAPGGRYRARISGSTHAIPLKASTGTRVPVNVPSGGLQDSRRAPRNYDRDGLSEESTPLEERAGARTPVFASTATCSGTPRNPIRRARENRGARGSYQRQRQAVESQAGPSAPASVSLAQSSSSADPTHPHEKSRGPGGNRTQTLDPHTDARVDPGASTSAFPPAEPPAFQKTGNSRGNCNWAEDVRLQREASASSSSKPRLPSSIDGSMRAIERKAQVGGSTHVGHTASRQIVQDHPPSENGQGEGGDGDGYVIYSTPYPNAKTSNGSRSAATPSNVIHGSTHYDMNNVLYETGPSRAPPSELHSEGPRDSMQAPDEGEKAPDDGGENRNGGHEGYVTTDTRRAGMRGQEHREGSSERSIRGRVRTRSLDEGNSDRPFRRSPDHRNST